MQKNLYSQVTQPLGINSRVLAVGEILWDVLGDSSQLGGAPLNFAVNTSRMGHEVILVSAVGDDAPGRAARQAVEAFGLQGQFIGTTARYPTGSALVEVDPKGHSKFHIRRPAAYDAVELFGEDLAGLVQWAPQWLYYGTLFSSTDHGRRTLGNLIGNLPTARRFYDVNLRPDSYSPELVRELLDLADVVKLNESEMEAAGEFAGLPVSTTEAFCRAGTAAYGWKAVCVTMGERGCAVLSDGTYAEAEGYRVEVVDTVGAGDGCAAAFLHGITQRWQPAEIGVLANRIGAMIVGSSGAIPHWDMSHLFVEAP
jgi:fructokinase